MCELSVLKCVWKLHIQIASTSHRGKLFNSVWPSDTLHHTYCSLMIQMMSYCLTAPCHYKNNADLLLTGPLGANLMNLNHTKKFSSRNCTLKCHLEILSIFQWLKRLAPNPVGIMTLILYMCQCCNYLLSTPTHENLNGENRWSINKVMGFSAVCFLHYPPGKKLPTEPWCT